MATSNNTIKVGFNLYLNKRFDSSVLDALRTNKDWLAKFKEDENLINLIMPPSGKNGVSIQPHYKPILQAAGFNVSSYGELIEEYKSRLYPDGRPKSTQSSKTANHSMFTSYQSSLVWTDGTHHSSDMSPLAFKYIESFEKSEDGTLEYEAGNNLFLLPSDMVEEFVDEADGDVSSAYDNINTYLTNHKDKYRFRFNWEIPSSALVRIYDFMKTSGLRSLGVIADASIIYDPSTSAVSSMILNNCIALNGDSFDFSTGTKLSNEDVAANHQAIKKTLSNAKPLSPFASGGWKKVKSGETTMTKLQKKKEAARAAKGKSSRDEMAEALLTDDVKDDVKELNKPIFVESSIDLDDLDISDS